jgi:hypothetical protein
MKSNILYIMAAMSDLGSYRSNEADVDPPGKTKTTLGGQYGTSHQGS